MMALEELGIPWRVMNVAALMKGDVEGALRFFGEMPSSPIIYRGWILRPAEYVALYEALAQRGGRMLTSPAEYRQGLLFPEFYPAIAEHSFPAVWSTGKQPQRAVAAARQLGPGPYFIKDYAKSAKENWPEGCVAANAEELPAAVRALVRFRGDDFEGGVVIRPLIKLRYLDESPFGWPVYEEYRLFFFQGRLISQTPYDRVGGDPATLPDYRFLPQRIQSPFFSADVVVTETGQPFLLEVGDGGASSLPPCVSPAAFYSVILEVLRSTTSSH